MPYIHTIYYIQSSNKQYDEHANCLDSFANYLAKQISGQNFGAISRHYYRVPHEVTTPFDQFTTAGFWYQDVIEVGPSIRQSDIEEDGRSWCSQHKSNSYSREAVDGRLHLHIVYNAGKLLPHLFGVLINVVIICRFKKCRMGQNT